MKNQKNKSAITTFILVLSIMFITISQANAELIFDNINFDPAIISSGDDVDVVIQFHEKPSINSQDLKIDSEKLASSDYYFKVELMPDDTLSQKYITMYDSQGDDMHGMIFTGEYYNKKFRLKVNYNAPPGDYQFELRGQWYYQGKPLDYYESETFVMPVKKEGISLDISSLNTVPSEVRPGDDYVKLSTRIENVGQKNAKSVIVDLGLPNDLKNSYSNNNRVGAGSIASGEYRDVDFYIDVDDYAKSGLYNLTYNLNYLDVDNNKYNKTIKLPFLVKSRPYLEVVKSQGSGLSGDSSKLKVIIKNSGNEDAESVDVRVLKQNSQPFSFDVRSDYIGEIKPGQTGEAIFDIDVLSDAEIKTHNLKLIVRAKGDSDQGDDNIYTFERSANFEVTGKQKNYYLTYGVYFALTLLVLLLLKNIPFKSKYRSLKW